MPMLCSSHPMQVHSAACLPLTSEHDNLFFRVVAKRYEYGAMILTLNLTCRVVGSGLRRPGADRSDARSAAGDRSQFQLYPPPVALTIHQFPR
jgi:hypothetical protein